MYPEPEMAAEPTPSDPPHPKMIAEQMEAVREQARTAAEFHERKAREARQTMCMAEASLEQHKIAALEGRKLAEGPNARG